MKIKFPAIDCYFNHSKMVAIEETNMKKTKAWRLVFTGNTGSSRHPSMRRQTVEVWEDTLHVKHAIYEPFSKTDGKSL